MTETTYLSINNQVTLNREIRKADDSVNCIYSGLTNPDRIITGLRQEVTFKQDLYTRRGETPLSNHTLFNLIHTNAWFRNSTIGALTLFFIYFATKQYDANQEEIKAQNERLDTYNPKLNLYATFEKNNSVDNADFYLETEESIESDTLEGDIATLEKNSNQPAPLPRNIKKTRKKYVPKKPNNLKNIDARTPLLADDKKSDDVDFFPQLNRYIANILKKIHASSEESYYDKYKNIKIVGDPDHPELCFETRLSSEQLKLTNKKHALLLDKEQEAAGIPIEKRKSKYNSLSFKYKEKIQGTVEDGADKAAKTLGPIWAGLALVVFAYWILYSVFCFFTGWGEIASIMGLQEAALGISFGIGAIYGGYAYKNFRKFRNHLPANEEEAIAGFTIINEALYMQEYNATKNSLEKTLGIKLNNDNQIESEARIIKYKDSLKNKKFILGSSFVSTTIESYIRTQYIAWIISDSVFSAARLIFAGARVVLPEIELICKIGGSLMMFIGTSISVYNTFKKSQAYNDHAPKETLEQRLNHQKSLFDLKKEKLNALKLNLPGSPCEIEKTFGTPKEVSLPQFKASKRTTKQFLGAALSKFVENYMTMVMLARIFLFKTGGAVLLPFVALSLSNPVTLGVTLGLGVGYGLFQIYKLYREERAKEEKAFQLEQEKALLELSRANEMLDLKIEAANEFQQKHQNAAAKSENQTINLSPKNEPAVDLNLNSQSTTTVYSELKSQGDLASSSASELKTELTHSPIAEAKAANSLIERSEANESVFAHLPEYFPKTTTVPKVSQQGMFKQEAIVPNKIKNKKNVLIPALMSR